MALQSSPRRLVVKLVLSTDAHNPGELAFMRYAVEQARRGWLESADIPNTRSVATSSGQRYDTPDVHLN